MLKQGNAPRLPVTGQSVGGAVGAEQLHQGRSDLLGATARFLSFERMPVALLDHQQPVQLLGQLPAALRPGAVGWGDGWMGGFREKRHWTRGGRGIHPGAMPHGLRTRTSSRARLNRPDGWLHSLASLLAVVARGERLAPRDTSSAARRLRQRLELGQRLLDPLPQPLRAGLWEGQPFWKALRWGGGGMLLAWWLLGR